MLTTLSEPKRRKLSQRKLKLKRKIRELKQKGIRVPSHTPNYVNIMPPGRVLAEKMEEMEIDAAELAKRMNMPLESLEKLLRYEIPLTQEVADKIQDVTGMDARLMMTFEASYQESLAFAMKYPEIPAYLGEKIINQPKKRVRKKENAEN